MGTHYRVKIPILSILRSTISTACHFSSSGTCSGIIMRPHQAHNVQFTAGNSYVSEMQLWFVTVSNNELDHCALWDTTRRFGAVHDTNGLASYVLWRYWWNTDWFRVKTEDWRLLLSTLIVRYKCCGNVVVFLAFRYVALALRVVALALALGVVTLALEVVALA